MKKKKLAALAMAGVMSMSMSVSVFAVDSDTVDSDTKGKAGGETNIGGEVNNSTLTEAYVMTIPAGNTNMDLTSTDEQEIGNLKVTLTEADKKLNKSFETDKGVSVTITSENNGKLKIVDGEDTLAYTLKVGSDSVESGEKMTFHNSNIDKEENFAMTATITGDSTTVANGTYQDKLTFSAEIVELNQ